MESFSRWQKLRANNTFIADADVGAADVAEGGVVSTVGVSVLGIKKALLLFGSRAGESIVRLLSRALLPGYPQNQMSERGLIANHRNEGLWAYSHRQVRPTHRGGARRRDLDWKLNLHP